MPELEGLVEDIVFRNEENGWTVLQIKHGKERVCATGIMPFVGSGERVKLTGDWVKHPEYGQQIKVTAYEVLKPSTITGIERYLASGLIKGVGPATAKLIVQEFGKNALEILETQPERLTEVSGIGAKRAAMIIESFAEQMHMRQTMVFLQGFGITPNLSVKIYHRYGDNAQSVVRSDPFMLVDDIKGVGFKIADGIAHALGIQPEAPARIASGIKYVLLEAAQNIGHVYLPRNELVLEAVRILQIDISLIENHLDTLLLNYTLVQSMVDDKVAIYLKDYYAAENEVAKRLIELSKTAKENNKQDIDTSISRFEVKQGINLCTEQRLAVTMAANEGMCIITGGPGTGKTTIINCILNLLKNKGEIALAAPTGRAAKRMTETTGEDAKTIHRMLEYSGEDGGFNKNENNPLECDVLIVDEMSMVDLFLIRSLLKALRNGTKIIMVGDADQLPSVGAGNVLKDIITSGSVPTVYLKEIFRQAEQSMIVINAHKINHGEMPLLNSKGSDFFLERKDTPGSVAETIIALCTIRLPAYASANPLKDIQVLAPMKKGEAGVWELNRKLQSALNPKRASSREMIHGDTLYRTGDKVMQIKNNYELVWKRGSEEGKGVYNGDMGFVCEVDSEEKTVSVEFDEERIVTYDYEQLDELELAYSITVHKSQGSEFPIVVIPVVPCPPMLTTRNLFYTAVTRARKLVVLVGKEYVVANMVKNDKIIQRYSALKQKLCSFI